MSSLALKRPRILSHHLHAPLSLPTGAVQPHPAQENRVPARAIHQHPVLRGALLERRRAAHQAQAAPALTLHRRGRPARARGLRVVLLQAEVSHECLGLRVWKLERRCTS